MAQQNNTMNYILHDSSGQPQMIKLVQSAGKSIGGIMAGISGQSMKLFKTTTGQDSTQTFTPVTQAQLMKAPKIVTKTVPISTMAQTFQKSSDGQIIKKTIRLTPQQMQGLKFINTTQKIQIQQSPQSLIKQPIASPTSKQFHTSPPILDHTGGRKRHETMDLEFTPDSKRRKTTEKVGKGLRHFSMKVCEKVRKKGTTSYNEVADELVAEFTNSAVNNSLAEQYDQKNIRRRVYDALNVLMAMNIISKEKKEIRWIGLPSNSVQECIQLEKEKQKKMQSIQEKRKNLQELILNQISFKNLTQRNMDLESCQGRPSTNSYIQLPFIVVNTNRKTVIDCSISQDKMEYLFQFNDKFEIHDDLEILKQIGMLMELDEGKCTAENLEKLKSLVPKALEEYVIQLANGTTSNLDYLIEKGAGPSNSTFINTDDLIETHLDEENSRQSSSCDPLSPGQGDFTDEEVDSDISSDD